MNASPSSPAQGNKVFYTGVLPPIKDYITEALIFPGTNAREPYEKQARFSFVFRVISGGREIARTAPQSCDEKGHVRINIDACMKGKSETAPSFALVEVESSADIPVSFYFAHIHRNTGIYYPAPAMMFMGDVIYPHIHAQQLENALFWPGVYYTSNTEFQLAVINPYEVPMSIEASGWHNTKGTCSSGMIRISPQECKWLPLDIWVPKSWRDDGQPISVSVAAQFKLVAEMVLINRSNGVITSTDHLHTYHLH